MNNLTGTLVKILSPIIIAGIVLLGEHYGLEWPVVLYHWLAWFGTTCIILFGIFGSAEDIAADPNYGVKLSDFVSIGVIAFMALHFGWYSMLIAYVLGYVILTFKHYK